VKFRILTYIVVVVCLAGVHVAMETGTGMRQFWALQEGGVSPLILGANFRALLRQVGLHLDWNDDFGVRVVADFGAVFGVESPAVPPPAYVFSNENEVTAFQQRVPAKEGVLANRQVALQQLAFEQLLAARAEAVKEGLTISPASDDSARRSYAMTVTLWESRVKPAIEHWVEAKRLSEADGQRLLKLEPAQQVNEVLRLEKGGMYFSTLFDKSILYSVAAPGTSQHLSLLALDVREHAIPEVRRILAQHGWYQTVYSDLPHFTFLGRAESELPALGLVQRHNAGRVFWVPDTIKTRGAPPGEPDVTETCPF